MLINAIMEVEGALIFYDSFCKCKRIKEDSIKRK